MAESSFCGADRRITLELWSRSQGESFYIRPSNWESDDCNVVKESGGLYYQYPGYLWKTDSFGR